MLKLAARSTAPTELPFTGLNHPYGVAVDAAGNVYVTDTGNNRVLKLPAQYRITRLAHPEWCERNLIGACLYLRYCNACGR